MTESDQYAVIACSECNEHWIIDEHEREKTATCPRCERRWDLSERTRLASADEFTVAAEQRARILAHKAGRSDELDDVADYGVLEDRLESAPTYADRLQNLADEALDETSQTAESHDTVEDLTTDPGSGPDVDVNVADQPQLDGTPVSPDLQPGLQWVNPGGQVSITGLVTRDVPPQRKQWLPDLLDDLLQYTARLVRDLAEDRDHPVLEYGRVATFVQDVLVDDVVCLDDAGIATAEREEARAYLEAIARYSLLWVDEEYRDGRGFDGRRQFDLVEDTLHAVGTGEGQFNAGIEALRHSLVQLHTARSSPLPLTFVLDGEAWTDADDATVRGSLRLFDALAEAFDVRVLAAPGTKKQIRRIVRNAGDVDVDEDDDSAAPGWVDRYESLTQTGRASRRAGPAEDDQSKRERTRDAWSVVEDHSTNAGLLTLLAHLDKSAPRSMRSLKRDDEIDYADSSLGVYAATLEDKGLAFIDRPHPSNRLSLTPLGRAAQAFVATDGSVVHPEQSRLIGESYGHPSASRKYSVAPQETGGVGYSPAEWWLAETGTPGEDAEFVEWLGTRDGPREVDPLVVHRRLEAGNRVEGVNFVDDNIFRWEENDETIAPTGDGRKVYASCFDDHMVIVYQWGGPAATLIRPICGLLDPKSLSKILDIDTVGTQFQNLHDGVNSFENDLEDVLQRAQQIGWLSEDELAHYDEWRDRVADVKALLLSKMGELGEMDAGLRRELMNDLQGLLTSATHLYHAAGVEITSIVRVPDPVELGRDEQRLQDFLDFMRYTVTKQAGYEDGNGFHSIYRMLIEDRPEKLKSRTAYDIDESDPAADLTMNWQVVGPGVSALRDDVEEAIDKETNRIREPIDEGVEDAALLEIPVVEANSHARTRALLREIGERKGFDRQHRDDLDRLSRVLEAALATDEWGPSPYLVADVLDSLESRDKPWDELDVQALQNGLATLPADTLFPTLKPAIRRWLKTLLEADQPLTRQDLIEATSESSWDRHHRALRAFWLVEETADGGFVACVEPWWSTTNDAAEPYHEPHPNPLPQPPGSEITRSGPRGDPAEVLMLANDGAAWPVVPPDRYYELGDRCGNPSPDWRETLADLGLEDWTTILRAYCDLWEDTVSPSYSTPSPVRIGPETVIHDDEQSSLAAATSG